MPQTFVVQTSQGQKAVEAPPSRRGRGRRAKGVAIGSPHRVLRIRVDQYTGPPKRQYLGLAGKSIRVVVAHERELDALFKGLVKFVEEGGWRRR